MPDHPSTLSRAAAVGLLACASTLAVAGRAGAQSGGTIRVGTVAADPFAEPLYAADGGFFSRAGLDVDVKTFPGSGAVASAVIGNALDFGLTDAIVLANAINRGLPLVAIAGAGLYETGDSATTVLCVAKDSPYNSAKDFEGTSIGVVSLGSLSCIAVQSWLAKNGADVSRIRFVEMKFDAMPAALARNTVAGAFLGEPVHSESYGGLRTIGDGFSAIASRLLMSMWFTRRDWLQANPATVKKLVAAIYDCARWANRHQDLTAPILIKYAKMTGVDVAAMRRMKCATELKPDLLQPVLDAGLRFKAVERPTSAASLIGRV